MKTKIIALEGIDGAGKGTQFAALKSALTTRGRGVSTLDFPNYGGFFGREIGDMLSGGKNGRPNADAVDARSMALWFACDRRDAFENFRDGESDFLLLNRYVLSNAVYQSIRYRSENPAADVAETDGFAAWVLALEHGRFKLPMPDVYFIFDIDADTSGRNVAKKGRRDYTDMAEDAYESHPGLMSAANNAYLSLSASMPNAKIIRCLENGQMRPPGDITQDMLREMEQLALISASV